MRADVGSHGVDQAAKSCGHAALTVTMAAGRRAHDNGGGPVADASGSDGNSNLASGLHSFAEGSASLIEGGEPLRSFGDTDYPPKAGRRVF